MINNTICLIVNPNAAIGQPLKVLKKIENILTNSHIKFSSHITTHITDAQKRAREAANRGEYIFVLGGDGTLRVIAEVLQYNTQTALGIIPCGRGNDLARVLKIPLDPVAACKALVNGYVTVMDMAEVNHKPYLTICSIGFDSVANEIASRTKFIRGRAIYAYAGLMALIHWQPTQFYVQIDGIEFEHVGYTVAVANSKCYGGGMLLAPNALITDGLLDVVLIGKLSKFRMIHNLQRVFSGTHIDEPGFKMMRAKHVHIEADAKYLLYADGDYISAPPANVRVLPNALKILVPNDTVIQ